MTLRTITLREIPIVMNVINSKIAFNFNVSASDYSFFKPDSEFTALPYFTEYYDYITPHLKFNKMMVWFHPVTGWKQLLQYRLTDQDRELSEQEYENITGIVRATFKLYMGL